MVSILDTEIALSVDPLVFHPAIKTEVVELDHDHEIMTEYLNNLHTSFKTGQTDRALLLFDEMLHFATMHFRREEDFLNEHGYPGAVQHEADHGRVLEEMAAAKALLAAGQGTEETVLEIKFCLIEHLLEDMRYKEFLALQR